MSESRGDPQFGPGWFCPCGHALGFDDPSLEIKKAKHLEIGPLAMPGINHQWTKYEVAH